MPRITRRDAHFAELGVDYATLKTQKQDVALGKEPAGLYICQPNYCVALGDATVEGTEHAYVDCYRCGSVGTKEVADEATSIDAAYNAKSSLSGRMQMYHSNWLGGGKILAFLKLSKEFVYNAQFLRVEQKYIDEFGRVGGAVKTRERQFHELLLREDHVQRVRGGKQSEWFAGPRDELLQALLRVTGKHHENRLYLFEPGGKKAFSASKVRHYLKVHDEVHLEEAPPPPDRTLRTLPGQRKRFDADVRKRYGA